MVSIRSSGVKGKYCILKFKHGTKTKMKQSENNNMVTTKI